jgi:hypothetical protein
MVDSTRGFRLRREAVLLMSKALYYVVAVVAMLVTAGGAYYYFSKVEVVNVQMPAPASTPPASSPTPPKPDHGDFQKRFEPKMPVPDGGKSK